MGNHASAQVTLDHDAFYPGNVVRGTAVLKVDAPTSIVASRIRCVGCEDGAATVVSVPAGAAGIPPVSHTHAGQRTFFEETLTLFGPQPGEEFSPAADGSKDAAKQHTIQPGHYTYPFEFELPAHLPGTTKLTEMPGHSRVEVRYFIEARLKLSTDVTHRYIKDFVVVSPINAKELDAAVHPGATVTKAVPLSWLLFDKGQAMVTAKVKRAFYAGGGDKIEADVTIDNSKGTMAIESINASVWPHVHWNLPDYAPSACTVVGEPLVRMKVSCSIDAGATVTVPLVVPLPHDVQHPSYPARGSFFSLHHTLTLGLGHGDDVVQVPMHIAHSADTQNRFEFVPNGTNAEGRQRHRKPYAYHHPNAAEQPHLQWQPPAGEQQPKPVAKTPQAADNLTLPRH